MSCIFATHVRKRPELPGIHAPQKSLTVSIANSPHPGIGCNGNPENRALRDGARFQDPTFEPGATFSRHTISVGLIIHFISNTMAKSRYQYGSTSRHLASKGGRANHPELMQIRSPDSSSFVALAVRHKDSGHRFLGSNCIGIGTHSVSVVPVSHTITRLGGPNGDSDDFRLPVYADSNGALRFRAGRRRQE
jgi:hypothetical protein